MFQKLNKYCQMITLFRVASGQGKKFFFKVSEKSVNLKLPWHWLPCCWLASCCIFSGAPVTKAESSKPAPVKHKDPQPANVTKPKSPEKKSTKSNVESPRTKCSKSSSPSSAPSPAVSQHVPSAKTPYEFLQAWSSMKPSQGPEAYLKLLEQVEPQDLCKGRSQWTTLNT